MGSVRKGGLGHIRAGWGWTRGEAGYTAEQRERQLYVYHKAKIPFPHQLSFTLRTNPQPLLGVPKTESIVGGAWAGLLPCQPCDWGPGHWDSLPQLCHEWQLSAGHGITVQIQHSSPREALRSAPHSYCSINHSAIIITTSGSSSVTTRPAWSGICPEFLPHILPWCPLRFLGSILAFFRFLHVIPYVTWEHAGNKVALWLSETAACCAMLADAVKALLRDYASPKDLKVVAHGHAGHRVIIIKGNTF